MNEVSKLVSQQNLVYAEHDFWKTTPRLQPQKQFYFEVTTRKLLEINYCQTRLSFTHNEIHEIFLLTRKFYG